MKRRQLYKSKKSGKYYIFLSDITPDIIYVYDPQRCRHTNFSFWYFRSYMQLIANNYRSFKS